MKLNNQVMLKLNFDGILISSRLMHANHATLLSCKVGSGFLLHVTLQQSSFSASKFPRYHNTFQTAMLTETIRAYPFLDRERLHNELSVLYEGEEMWHENLLDF